MTTASQNKYKNILLIRRDNIGDLVCTTPAIAAVRQTYPNAKLAVLVNSYNAEVLANNPHIDKIYVYEKGKHRGNMGRLSVLASNARLMRQIRGQKFDAAIACSSSYSPRLAKQTFLTGARLRIGYGEKGRTKSGLYYNSPLAAPEKPLHEVEAVMGLLRPLGVTCPAPPLLVRPDKKILEKVSGTITKDSGGKTLIAFHISSRRPENRWPIESFIELIRSLSEAFNIQPLVLWSPGAADNPKHPGDDEAAAIVGKALGDKAVLYKTRTLSELIAALSLTEIVVSLDGGAMHIAAGLGKPVLTIWGSTDARRWAPWGVEFTILSKKERLAESVSVEEAFAAFKRFKIIKELARKNAKEGAL